MYDDQYFMDSEFLPFRELHGAGSFRISKYPQLGVTFGCTT
jgi:hypothetical protein